MLGKFACSVPFLFFLLGLENKVLSAFVRALDIDYSIVRNEVQLCILLKSDLFILVFFYSIQILNPCIICCDEGWNLPELQCCRQACHKRCLKRWRRALIESSSSFPHCRAALPAGPTEDEEYNQEIMELLQEVRTVLEYQCWITQLFIFFSSVSYYRTVPIVIKEVRLIHHV